MFAQDALTVANRVAVKIVVSYKMVIHTLNNLRYRRN